MTSPALGLDRLNRLYMVVSTNKGPQYRPQRTINRIMRHPENSALFNLGMPDIDQSEKLT